ncbi:hypothetical protein [Duganella aceris]|uniref:Phage tail protein n=1 Tax=Duganella aceris TaxID=2703883 RepID=A0ABX0FP56_9BURK|nr:hypothetical protein [Duganella aceris]NGZ86409.1 hypothetical protein [Duganella aceris]
MSTKYKTIISNTARIPVKGSISDADGNPVPFKFALICTRMSAKEMKDRLVGGEVLMQEVLQEVAKGWEKQTLVLDEDDKPAPFNEDSFAALLEISGMAAVCFNAYVKGQAATEKN